MNVVSELPPNATAQERALEQATARLGGVPVEIGTVWDPWTCPAGMLPWLAWALSVDGWSSEWTEAQKRAAIAASVAVHRTKGTVGALKRALQALGYDVEVDEHTGEVYTFRLAFDLNQTGMLTSETFLSAKRVALANKNVRSHLLAIRSVLTNTANFHIGLAQYRAQTVTVDAGQYSLPIDNHTLILLQVDAEGNIVERTGKPVVTKGNIIRDASVTHDGYGSIRNTDEGGITATGGIDIPTYDLNIQVQDYTFEGWWLPLVDFQNGALWFNIQLFDSSALAMASESGFQLYASSTDGSMDIMHTITPPPQAATWHHICIQQRGLFREFYFDGVIVSSLELDSAPADFLAGLSLGSPFMDSSPAALGPCCWENVRFSDVARYSENFTPPRRL